MTDAAQITVVFEGPDTQNGVSVHDLHETLNGLQDAVRLMAAHLAGAKTQGRPPEWLRRQSSLRLQAVFAGSFGAALTLPSHHSPAAVANYGEQALDAIFDWGADGNPGLPDSVVNRLNAIGSKLSPEIGMIRFGDSAGGRQFTIGRTQRQRRPAIPRRQGNAETTARLHGRLMAVNWNRGTAELHSYGAPVVVLRFDANFNETMRQLATRFVKVTGVARVADGEEWGTVAIDEIAAEPSEIDDFYARRPKTFDPAQAIGFYRQDDDDAVDIKEFIRFVHEGRDL